MKYRTFLTAAGIGLAVALALPLAAGDTLLHTDEGPHAWLGVVLDEAIDRPEGGVLVVRVLPDSPAARAGLLQDDVVVAAGGRAVHGPRALTRVIRDREPGETVDLTVVRDGAERRLTAELGERQVKLEWRIEGDDLPLELDVEGLLEDSDLLRRHVLDMRDRVGELNGPIHELRLFTSRPKLGVQLTEASPELREHLGGRPDAGVLVSRVLENSAALAAGVEVGDLIEAVDGEPIEDAGDLIRVLRDADGRRITLDLIRDGRSLSLDAEIPMPESPEGRRGPRA